RPRRPAPASVDPAPGTAASRRDRGARSRVRARAPEVRAREVPGPARARRQRHAPARGTARGLQVPVHRRGACRTTQGAECAERPDSRDRGGHRRCLARGIRRRLCRPPRWSHRRDLASRARARPSSPRGAHWTVTGATLQMAGSPRWITVAVLLPISSLTVVAVVLGEGSVAVAVTPLIVAALVWWMWKAPLRISVLLLMFVGLVLEDPDQRPAGGAWESPLSTLGAVMLAHLNVTIWFGALFFSGIGVVVVFLFFVFFFCHLKHTRFYGDPLRHF